jgi:methylglutaconyl-CoA hydratase
MAISTAGAKFSFSEARLGLLAATIGPYVVAALGPRMSRGLLATARVFDAAYAEKIGLVNEVVADATALDAAQAALAAEIMACAPGAIAEAKRLVNDIVFKPVDHGLMRETADRIAHARVSDEGREGVAAFLGRRKPAWTSI